MGTCVPNCHNMGRDLVTHYGDGIGPLGGELEWWRGLTGAVQRGDFGGGCYEYTCAVGVVVLTGARVLLDSSHELQVSDVVRAAHHLAPPRLAIVERIRFLQKSAGFRTSSVIRAWKVRNQP